MFKTVMFAVSGALIAAAAPAIAEPIKTAPDTPTELSTAPAAVSSAPKAVKATRYCVEQTLTGSRIPSRACHTREDWLSRGFDPLAK